MVLDNNHVVVLAPGEGRQTSLAGVQLTFKVTSADTGGKYACYEYVAPAGFGGPPPHTHAGFDEFWYVLEGALTLQAGDQLATAESGGFIHVPGATPHAFSNPSQTPTRFLGLIIPGGFERYFDELAAVVAQHGYPPPPEVMHELGRKYGVDYAPPAPL